MSWMPIGIDQWVSKAKENQESDVSRRQRTLGAIMRAVFIVSLLIVMIRVSMPQSSSLLDVYATPGDLIRLLIGVVASIWVASQLFMVPKDGQAYRTWVYLGLAAVPFALICIVGTW
jgi:hypothetical protein